ISFGFFVGSAFVAAAPSSGPDGPPSPRGGEELVRRLPLIPLPVGERVDRAQPETGDGAPGCLISNAGACRHPLPTSPGLSAKLRYLPRQGGGGRGVCRVIPPPSARHPRA